ncbi:MAG: hypothetical protein NXH75_05115 [Halobacteriovoraceae bacterium]|nr:hypothetical protein [Halobacteriovoraceae bacterium]
MDQNPIYIFPLVREDKGFVFAMIFLFALFSLHGLYLFGFQYYHYGSIDIWVDLRTSLNTLFFIGAIIYLLFKKPKRQALILFEDGLELCEINRGKKPSRSLQEIKPDKISKLTVFGSNGDKKLEIKLSFNFEISGVKEKKFRNIEISSPPHKREEILNILNQIIENGPFEKKEGGYNKGDVNSPYFNLDYERI